jgi:hypothetical protein
MAWRDRERCLNFVFQVMVELRTRKREMGNKHEHDLQNMSRYEKSGV